MRIIVLDSSPANDGDLSWKDLEALGTLTVYDSTTPEQVVERCRDAEAVFSNKVVMDRHRRPSAPPLHRRPGHRLQ